MIEISKYVKTYKVHNDEIILYNTTNRSIISLSPNMISDRHFIEEELTVDDLNELKEMGFIQSENIMNDLQSSYSASNTLIISLETVLSCNLACPYCYQKGTHNNRTVSKLDLDLLIEYCKQVYRKEEYHTLVLKVLGGEPAIRWDLSEYIISNLNAFCLQNGIIFKLMIDTNGTIVKEYFSLNELQNILFTIPLSHRSCHNLFRKYKSGEGSYDDIINNVILLKKVLPQADIVLRCNMDNDNIHRFREFIHDLKNKLKFIPIISPNYTLELGDTKFKNDLTHDEFIKWCSSTFIDIMVEVNYPIIVAPATLTTKCQYWQSYSLKMFSDGTTGACAMSFFMQNRPHIREVIKNLDNIGLYWDGAKNYNLLEDKKCMDCENLFLCCGAYKIPCISSLNLQQCKPDKNVNVDLELFLLKYLMYSKKGYAELFVGFNNYEIYK